MWKTPCSLARRLLPAVLAEEAAKGNHWRRVLLTSAAAGCCCWLLLAAEEGNGGKVVPLCGEFVMDGNEQQGAGRVRQAWVDTTRGWCMLAIILNHTDVYLVGDAPVLSFDLFGTNALMTLL